MICESCKGAIDPLKEDFVKLFGTFPIFKHLICHNKELLELYT